MARGRQARTTGRSTGWRALAVLTTMAAATVALGGSSEGAAPVSPTQILVIGDSISGARIWQQELDRLLDVAGVPHEVVTEAGAGATCGQLASYITPILAAHDPDLVVLQCGTNDDPGSQIYGEPTTGWALRTMVEAIHAKRPADPIPVLPALVQYSDPLIAPGWLWAGAEPLVNDLLWTNLRASREAGRGYWLAGIVDLQRIPATATYLDDGGIHPTHRGHRYIARLVYDEAATRMGWPASKEAPLCDLYGHRTGTGRPPFRPCL